MRRAVLATTLLGACSYVPGVPAEAPDAPPGTAEARCHFGATDPALRLCLDFEDQPLVDRAIDLSSGHHDASVAGATTVPRVGQRALETSAMSHVTVPVTDDLALSDALTVEIWISTQASMVRTLPLTNNDHYALAVENGQVECYIGGATMLQSFTQVTDGQWHYIACSFDPRDRIARIYVGGDNVACYGIPKPQEVAATVTQIGADYVGGLDDVHVYARTLDDAEICEHAGGPCNPYCPNGVW